MKSLWSVVFFKELREALRDRRSLTLMLSLVILMPAMMMLSLQFAIKRATQDENETIQVMIINGEQAKGLQSQLTQAGITLKALPRSADAAKHDSEMTRLLADRKLTAIIEIGPEFRAAYDALRPAQITIWYNSATEQQAKTWKLKRQMQRYQRGIAEWRLIARGVAPGLLAPLELREFDVASQSERAGSMLSFLFGMLFWSVFGIGVSMTIDATAGERERRTLELLLAQPVHGWQIVGGKWLAAALFAFVGLTLEVAGVHVVLSILPLEEIGMSWQIGLAGLLPVIISGIPLCLFAAAFIMALSLNTKSFKEAQSSVSIAMLAPMLPVMVVPMLDLGRQSWMFAVPALGHGEAVKALIKGQSIAPLEWALLLGVPSLLALLLARFCIWRIESERFVVGV
ncbi:ABC transporter permease [Massilia sp. W12]|uniref:ABC transporter permease n=1 Tax=Massilia sp. W12 TaxID=3126507 RepID=UPI0030D5B50A